MMRRRNKLNHPPDDSAYGTESIPTPDKELTPWKHVFQKDVQPKVERCPSGFNSLDSFAPSRRGIATEWLFSAVSSMNKFVKHLLDKAK